MNFALSQCRFRTLSRCHHQRCSHLAAGQHSFGMSTAEVSNSGTVTLAHHVEVLGITRDVLDRARHGDYVCGPLFGAAGVTWRLKLYLRSYKDDQQLSLYLQMVHSPNSAPVRAERFTLAIAGVAERQHESHTFSMGLGNEGQLDVYQEDFGWGAFVNRDATLAAIASSMQGGGEGSLEISATVVFVPPQPQPGPSPVRFRLQFPGCSSKAPPPAALAETTSGGGSHPPPPPAPGPTTQPPPPSASRKQSRKEKRSAGNCCIPLSSREGGAVPGSAGTAAVSSPPPPPPPDVMLVLEDGAHRLPADSGTLRRHSPVFAALLSPTWALGAAASRGDAAGRGEGAEASAQAAGAAARSSSRATGAAAAAEHLSFPSPSAPPTASAAAFVFGSLREVAVPSEICAHAMKSLLDYMTSGGKLPNNLSPEEARSISPHAPSLPLLACSLSVGARSSPRNREMNRWLLPTRAGAAPLQLRRPLRRRPPRPPLPALTGGLPHPGQRGQRAPPGGRPRRRSAAAGGARLRGARRERPRGGPVRGVGGPARQRAVREPR